MLGQRIVTAVILLAILAAAMMSANPWWFVALLALAAACASGKLRLTLPQPPSPLICAGVPVLLFAAMLALSSAWLGGAGPAGPTLAGSWAMRRPPSPPSGCSAA